MRSCFFCLNDICPEKIENLKEKQLHALVEYISASEKIKTLKPLPLCKRCEVKLDRFAELQLRLDSLLRQLWEEMFEGNLQRKKDERFESLRIDVLTKCFYKIQKFTPIIKMTKENYQTQRNGDAASTEASVLAESNSTHKPLVIEYDFKLHERKSKPEKETVGLFESQKNTQKESIVEMEADQCPSQKKTVIPIPDCILKTWYVKQDGSMGILYHCTDCKQQFFKLRKHLSTHASLPWESGEKQSSKPIPQENTPQKDAAIPETVEHVVTSKLHCTANMETMATPTIVSDSKSNIEQILGSDDSGNGIPSTGKSGIAELNNNLNSPDHDKTEENDSSMEVETSEGNTSPFQSDKQQVDPMVEIGSQKTPESQKIIENDADDEQLASNGIENMEAAKDAGEEVYKSTEQATISTSPDPLSQQEKANLEAVVTPTIVSVPEIKKEQTQKRDDGNVPSTSGEQSGVTELNNSVKSEPGQTEENDSSMEFESNEGEPAPPQNAATSMGLITSEGEIPSTHFKKRLLSVYQNTCSNQETSNTEVVSPQPALADSGSSTEETGQNEPPARRTRGRGRPRKTEERAQISEEECVPIPKRRRTARNAPLPSFIFRSGTIVKNGQRQRAYSCTLCYNRFPSSRLTMHKRRHGIDRFECDKCDASFYTSQTLLKHKWRIHGEEN